MLTLIEGPDAVSRSGGGPLEVVVGFDGSRASFRALETARELVEDRAGRVHAVWVAHLPGYAALSVDAVQGIRLSFEALFDELRETAAGILGPLGDRWRFERRDGNAAHQLFAAASEVRERSDPDAMVMIVVGTAEHAWHRLGGSVASHLAHQREFVLVVTPAATEGREDRPLSAATAGR